MGQVKRRQLLITASAVVAWPLIAVAQAKLRSIGLLWQDSVKPSPYQVTLLQTLSAKGYVANRNIHVEDRISLEGYGQLAKNATDLVRANVDVIVSYGGTATLAAAEATRDIPIVMITGTDPARVTASLSRPATNVTGVYLFTQELTAKRVELLKELVPRLSRLGLLVTPESRGAATLQHEIESAARSLRVELLSAEVRGAQDLEGAFAKLSQSRVDALMVPGSTLLSAHSARVVSLAANYRLPAIYPSQRFVEAGGLMSYSADIHQAFALAATYVERILGGTRVSDLPFERISKIELAINLKTARALRLNIPQSVLLRADKVIE